MNSITKKAYAKVNLSLDVLRRRPDGYHEVKMIMQTVGIYDELTFSFEEIVENDSRADDSSTNDRRANGSRANDSRMNSNESIQTTDGAKIVLEFPGLPKDVDLGPVEKNLIYRAAKLVMDEYYIQKRVTISLKKNIPVAAGMAGGSTDAAAVFHGLNELFELNMSPEKMCELGVKLGADIPFCIMGGTYLSEGIGEILTPIATPPQCVLLVAKPDISVSTKFVYENLHANELKVHPDVDGMIEFINKQDLNGLASLLGNVLENVSENAYPIISEIKTLMKDEGALNSLMSGSGPTVFGIFTPDEDGKNKANTAKRIIEEKNLANQIFITEFV